MSISSRVHMEGVARRVFAERLKSFTGDQTVYNYGYSGPSAITPPFNERQRTLHRAHRAVCLPLRLQPAGRLYGEPGLSARTNCAPHERNSRTTTRMRKSRLKAVCGQGTEGLSRSILAQAAKRDNAVWFQVTQPCRCVE